MNLNPYSFWLIQQNNEQAARVRAQINQAAHDTQKHDKTASQHSLINTNSIPVPSLLAAGIGKEILEKAASNGSTYADTLYMGTDEFSTTLAKAPTEMISLVISLLVMFYYYAKVTEENPNLNEEDQAKLMAETLYLGGTYFISLITWEYSELLATFLIKLLLGSHHALNPLGGMLVGVIVAVFVGLVCTISDAIHSHYLEKEEISLTRLSKAFLISFVACFAWYLINTIPLLSYCLQNTNFTHLQHSVREVFIKISTWLDKALRIIAEFFVAKKLYEVGNSEDSNKQTLAEPSPASSLERSAASSLERSAA
ncbi:MAG: hypothetical protein KIT27_12390, partial [Legionellales bacterium]|nr:hypothetical protein [Legionellales bacterium]